MGTMRRLMLIAAIAAALAGCEQGGWHPPADELRPAPTVRTVTVPSVTRPASSYVTINPAWTTPKQPAYPGYCLQLPPPHGIICPPH